MTNPTTLGASPPRGGLRPKTLTKSNSKSHPRKPQSPSSLQADMPASSLENNASSLENNATYLCLLAEWEEETRRLREAYMPLKAALAKLRVYEGPEGFQEADLVDNAGFQ